MEEKPGDSEALGGIKSEKWIVGKLVFPEEEGRSGDRSTTRAGALVQLCPTAPHCFNHQCNGSVHERVPKERNLQIMIHCNGFPSEPEQPGMLKLNFSYRSVVHFARDHDKNFFPCQQQSLLWIFFFFLKTIFESPLRKQMCSRG